MVSPQLLSILQRTFPPAVRRRGPLGYTDAQIVACLVLGSRLQARSLRHLVPVTSVAHLKRVLTVLWLERLLARIEAGSEGLATKFGPNMAL